jgi:hypothetical protein
MELQITVYDDNDKAVKVCKAQTVDIKFGQISAIMELIDVENIENNSELLKTVHRAWKQLKKILGKIFPDMTEDDWDYISVKELLPVVVAILKDSFREMMTIPQSKNE